MKRSETQRAKATAWGWFSKYVRIRDCLHYMGNKNNGMCITCGDVFPVEKLDAGHFVPGRNNAILFDERNCHTQCRQCNRFRQGRWPDYYEFMLKYYGIERINELLELRKVELNLTAQDYRSIADKYRKEYKELNNG